MGSLEFGIVFIIYTLYWISARGEEEALGRVPYHTSSSHPYLIKSSSS